MEKTIEQKWKEAIELRRIQAQPLHAIFSMTETQAKVALCMVMYGAGWEYSVAVSSRLLTES